MMMINFILALFTILIFWRLTIRKKKFIEKVFEEERILCHCFIGDESERGRFACFLHKVYREKLEFMIQGLKGKMAFREFNKYRKWMK